MDLKESVQSMAEKFSSTGDVKRLYGDPVEKNGKTIIPVAAISYGMGGGGGKHIAGSNTDGEGEGSGGAITAKPIGVVEISDRGTRFIRFNQLPFLIVVILLSWTLKGIIKSIVKR